jgi:NAD(P)-dependent dehydrogenase (short-subunit alcohol dehydrogenase family)
VNEKAFVTGGTGLLGKGTFRGAVHRRRTSCFIGADLADSPRRDRHPHAAAESQAGPFYEYVQRQGERPEEYSFDAFLATRDGDEVEELAGDFPKRWHVEEFFNAHQALGWNRAGTCDLNIRYGKMTTGLVAQAAIDQFRKRLDPPTANWDAKHMATAYFGGTLFTSPASYARVLQKVSVSRAPAHEVPVRASLPSKKYPSMPATMKRRKSDCSSP